MRFGLARRLLGAVTGEDIKAPDLARMLDYADKAAYRWESGEDRPRDATVDEFAKICQAAGLPITASWLERGETELPPIIIPAAALTPPVVAPVVPVRVTPVVKKRKPAPRGAPAANARKSGGAR